MRFLHADKVFNGDIFLDEDTVLVLNDEGILSEFATRGQVPDDKLEQLKGILCPGFVNAHCHLELSHLLGVVPRSTGLPGFGQHIITKRGSISSEQAAEAITMADAQMWANGIVATGDISNDTSTIERKRTSRIHYHTFVELLALDPARAGSVFNDGLNLLQHFSDEGLSASLAPHAPYSCSRELIRMIAEYDKSRNLPLCIHNQESEEETKFFAGLPSGFHELYQYLGMDISFFRSPGISALLSYADLLAGTRSMLVHNTCTTATDLNKVPEDVFWCFCPAANLYIENRLPQFALFTDRLKYICLGTDSLASNDKLDLLQEANIVLEHSTAFSCEDLLRAITSNPARALGIDDRFGRLVTGKDAGINLLRHEKNKFCHLQKIS